MPERREGGALWVCLEAEWRDSDEWGDVVLPSVSRGSVIVGNNVEK